MEKKIKKGKFQNFSGKALKIKKIVSQPKFKYTVLILMFALIAFSIQYFVNRPNFGAFLSSDMDPSGNTYVLGVDEEKGIYKISKILPSGSTQFQMTLEKSNSDSEYVYSNLEVDSGGNFYFVKQKKDLTAVVSDKTMYPTLNESVLMYDTNGNYVKQIAAIDFTKDSTPPTEPYIRKIQLVDQKLTIITCENNHYEVISANPLADESPRKIKSFDITPNTAVTSQNYQWVNDISILSTGRIFYSTLNGELYATNNEGNFENYSSIMNSKPFQIISMNVDQEDNLYFNDCINGKFCKLNTKSGMVQSLYSLENNLSESLNITLGDVRSVKVISEGDYYAASKAFDKPFHVRFGSNKSKLVGDLRNKLFPWGYLIMFGIILAETALYYIIKYLLSFELKRIPLATRMITLFLPVFVASMGVLVYVNTKDGVNEYIKVLRNEQENGAKTAADAISGSDFAKLNHVSGYMSSDYVKLKNLLQKGHKDIYSKIGDRSDYLVTYIESYGKLYTTINTKYDVSSSSFDKLKYTSPDMISPRYALVDYLLEQDEKATLYKIWSDLSDRSKNQSSEHATFRDVYGDISATFAPIKDTNGNVVGIVGNFLDEEIHSQREFWEILKHSSALILIITVLVGCLTCFAIKWSLRPLKKIEKAIDTIGKGTWNTRISINTKDELADIANAFNLMSEKIERYTSNLIRLNKEYIRYVPQEIFKLMDKEKITQVDLYNHKVVEMNVIYLSFNISSKGCFDFEKENEIFEAVNTSYDELFKIVQKNKGIVQSFTGLDAVILFPESANDALSASIQFKEVPLPEEIKQRMHITLGHGDALIGISGNEDRRGAIVISDEIVQMFNIDSRLNLLGIDHIATGNIINLIDKNLPFQYRYIGKAGNSTDSGYEDIYQIMNGLNKYSQDLYASTKEIFEKGIKLYLQGEFPKARKMFTDVLRVNENDKVSVKYMMMCDEESSKQEKNPESIQDFTGYII